MITFSSPPPILFPELLSRNVIFFCKVNKILNIYRVFRIAESLHISQNELFMITCTAHNLHWKRGVYIPGGNSTVVIFLFLIQILDAKAMNKSDIIASR